MVKNLRVKRLGHNSFLFTAAMLDYLFAYLEPHVPELPKWGRNPLKKLNADFF